MPGVRACPVLGFDGDNAVRGHLQRCQGKVSVWLVLTSFAIFSLLQDPLNFENTPIPKYKTKSPSNDFSSYSFCQFSWRPREERASEGVEESLRDGGQGEVFFPVDIDSWHCLLTLTVHRVEICRDRHDWRSCKICASCVNFPGNQRSDSYNLLRTTRFTHTKWDFALKLLTFYTRS